ncbi:MAG: hypothetical protein KatS3mg118_2845 [Paracoccaceae bacterium]|nr:MAG: hypothetical protein KatS3mg118_2845 [Paracoccaceae bacterium]
MRALVLSGGIAHPFAETSAAMAGILADAGLGAEIAPAGPGLDRLDENWDLVVINALAFTMTQAEKYAPLRAAHAFSISPDRRAALRDHLAGGGGLLGLHAAAICFDDWPEWGDILGARWIWGRSGHPSPDYLEVTPLSGHGLTEGLRRFRVWDELYCDLALAGDARVLATARCREQTRPQPVLTAREGPGRVVWSGLGHDMTSFATPAHRMLLTRAIHWVLRLI